MRFGMFFLNEYAGLTIMSMVAVTLFFGGWQGPWAGAVVVLRRGAGCPRLVPRSRPTSWCSCWSGSASRCRACRSTSSWASPGRSSSRWAWSTSLATGGHHALGAALEAWAWPIFSWVALLAFVGLFDPVLQAGGCASSASAAGGERLMLGMFKAMRTTSATCRRRRSPCSTRSSASSCPSAAAASSAWSSTRPATTRAAAPARSARPTARCRSSASTTPASTSLPAPNEARIARGAPRRAARRRPRAARSRCIDALPRARHRPDRHAAEHAGGVRLPAAPGAAGDRRADRHLALASSTAWRASTTSSGSRRWASTSSRSATAPPATWPGRR